MEHQIRSGRWYVTGLVDFALLGLALICIIFGGDFAFRSGLVSTLVIIISLHLFAKSRHDRILILLTGFIAYVNISLAFSDILGVGMS